MEGGFRGVMEHIWLLLNYMWTVVSDRSVWCYMQYCCISREALCGKHHIRFKNGRGRVLNHGQMSSLVLLQCLKYKVVLKSLSRH